MHKRQIIASSNAMFRAHEANAAPKVGFKQNHVSFATRGENKLQLKEAATSVPGGDLSQGYTIEFSSN